MLGHGIKMGRDALFDLLSANHMLVRKRKRRVQTPNQIHHALTPIKSEKLWKNYYQKKTDSCKLNSGLSFNCNFISGLIN